MAKAEQSIRLLIDDINMSYLWQSSFTGEAEMKAVITS